MGKFAHTRRFFQLIPPGNECFCFGTSIALMSRETAFARATTLFFAGKRGS
jgi:hypothetical protein